MATNVLAHSLTSVTGTLWSYTGLMPPLYDMDSVESTQKDDVRVIQAASIVIGIMIGVSTSLLAKSPVPFILAVGTLFALTVMYEKYTTS